LFLERFEVCCPESACESDLAGSLRFMARNIDGIKIAFDKNEDCDMTAFLQNRQPLEPTLVLGRQGSRSRRLDLKPVCAIVPGFKLGIRLGVCGLIRI
jgi:hypothetical protein